MNLTTTETILQKKYHDNISKSRTSLKNEPHFGMSLQSTTDGEKEIVLFALQNEIFSGIDGMSNLIAKASSYGIASFLKKKLK